MTDDSGGYIQMVEFGSPDFVISSKVHPYGGVVTSSQRLIARLSTQYESLSAEAWDRIQAEVPAYAQRDREELLPGISASIRAILLALHESRDFTEPELAGFVSYGQTRARQGIPTEDMLRAWRLSIRHILDAMITTGRARGVSDTSLVDLTRDLLSATDAATLAFTQGHHAAELELARQDQDRRTDFVRGVLFASLGPAEVKHQARRYGLDPNLNYLAIRAQPTAELPVEAIAGVLGLSYGTSRPQGMVALVDGDVVGFLSQRPNGQIGTAIGVGPPARLDALQQSFQQATRAMATAAAFDLTGPHDLGHLGLLPSILDDTDVGEELTRRYIAPLATGKGTRLILETVRHYLSLGMRADVTAERLSVHHNTVRYRLRRYQELTGVDLRHPDSALEAWWALQYSRLDHHRPTWLSAPTSPKTLTRRR